ncbi:MAG: hypothetical protein Tsb005_12180 [Gammaproteobacteria bacterium]
MHAVPKASQQFPPQPPRQQRVWVSPNQSYASLAEQLFGVSTGYGAQLAAENHQHALASPVPGMALQVPQAENVQLSALPRSAALDALIAQLT